jgi:hypothetical protein
MQYPSDMQICPNESRNHMECSTWKLIFAGTWPWVMSRHQFANAIFGHLMPSLAKSSRLTIRQDSLLVAACWTRLRCMILYWTTNYSTTKETKNIRGALYRTLLGEVQSSPAQKSQTGNFPGPRTPLVFKIPSWNNRLGTEGQAITHLSQLRLEHLVIWGDLGWCCSEGCTPPRLLLLLIQLILQQGESSR